LGFQTFPGGVMAKDAINRTIDMINKNENEILDNWIKEQLSASTLRSDLMGERELRQQSIDFLNRFKEAIISGNDNDIYSKSWTSVRDLLNSISRTRAAQGYTPSETAVFVFSLKQPLFTAIYKEFTDEVEAIKSEVWNITIILDKLGLYTTEIFIKNKEEIIYRQQKEMIELSTPVVQLWTGILALPLIGTLDSARTQVVMENLLTKIVETGSNFAIIDITGVPTVDTLVAQHLLKTVSAARLMGADCIISGIRPQIAQTIVHLGVDLMEVITKATMADAFKLALAKTGSAIVEKKYLSSKNSFKPEEE
jgi:rsbT co-antagonist protein RsbR